MSRKKVINFNDAAQSQTITQMENRVKDLENGYQEVCEMAVRSILQALDMKDHYTFGHSMRVTYYSLTLGKEIGLDSNELYQLELASLFHDIGKIGIPDSILLKPERLNNEEFQIMKTHPEKTAEILEGFKPFQDIARYAKHHHERYDGRGYPSQLKGEEIPLYSRIILIADTFDAMTSTRPYRKGLPYQVAFDELEKFSGSQFDPKLAQEFIKAMKKDQKKQENTFSLSIIKNTFEKNAA
jgi:putative nucleotidyltransferase with HDIG domain